MPSKPLLAVNTGNIPDSTEVKPANKENPVAPVSFAKKKTSLHLTSKVCVLSFPADAAGIIKK